MAAVAMWQHEWHSIGSMIREATNTNKITRPLLSRIFHLLHPPSPPPPPSCSSSAGGGRDWRTSSQPRIRRTLAYGTKIKTFIFQKDENAQRGNIVLHVLTEPRLQRHPWHPGRVGAPHQVPLRIWLPEDVCGDSVDVVAVVAQHPTKGGATELGQLGGRERRGVLVPEPWKNYKCAFNEGVIKLFLLFHLSPSRILLNCSTRRHRTVLPILPPATGSSNRPPT